MRLFVGLKCLSHRNVMRIRFVKMHNRLPLGVEGKSYGDLHQVEAILKLLLIWLGHGSGLGGGGNGGNGGNSGNSGGGGDVL